MTALCVFAAVLALWLFLIFPSPKRHRIDSWRGRLLAHRGLHDADHGIIENTLPAFEAACRSGYGIELDIQFTRDKKVVVFHDDDLTRLCGDERLVRQVDYEELKTMRPGGGAQPIPTLSQVLSAVGGRAPLLIELKNGPDNALLCQALVAHLKDYRGEYIVESFSPFIVAWFRCHAPQIPRGQLCTSPRGYRPKVPRIGGCALSALLFNCLARPDFIAYDASARCLGPLLQRLLFHTPRAAWTVRSDALLAAARKKGDMAIFESIRP